MKILRILSIILLSILPCKAEDIQPTEQTKGCVMTGGGNSEGNAWFIFFIKVADSEFDSDEGEPQIWGYNPQDIHKDRNGKPFYIQVLSKRFVRSGGFGRIGAWTCHCPSW